MEDVNERKAQIRLLHLYADIYLNVYQKKREVKKGEEKKNHPYRWGGATRHMYNSKLWQITINKKRQANTHIAQHIST